MRGLPPLSPEAEARIADGLRRLRALARSRADARPDLEQWEAEVNELGPIAALFTEPPPDARPPT